MASRRAMALGGDRPIDIGHLLALPTWSLPPPMAMPLWSQGPDTQMASLGAGPRSYLTMPLWPPTASILWPSTASILWPSTASILWPSSASALWPSTASALKPSETLAFHGHSPLAFCGLGPLVSPTDPQWASRGPVPQHLGATEPLTSVTFFFCSSMGYLPVARVSGCFWWSARPCRPFSVTTQSHCHGVTENLLQSLRRQPTRDSEAL